MVDNAPLRHLNFITIALVLVALIVGWVANAALGIVIAGVVILGPVFLIEHASPCAGSVACPR